MTNLYSKQRSLAGWIFLPQKLRYYSSGFFTFSELHQGAAEALECGAGDQHADPGPVRHPAGHGAGQLGGRRHLE